MKQLVAETEVDADGFLFAEGESFHHMRDVLRTSCGDMICVRLKNGTLQPMTVCKVDTQAKRITLQIANDSLSNGILFEKPTVAITLFQLIAKPPKMDLIVRQAAECGVENIFPVEGEFCQKGNVESARKKTGDGGRWQKIVTEARQQSGSPVETRVFDPIAFSQIPEVWKSEMGSQETSLAIVLYERSDGAKTIHDALKNADSSSDNFSSTTSLSRIALVVGAEGGISSSEIKLLKQNDFIPVHFATNILRCETATLYGIAALQTALQTACKQAKVS